MEASPKLSWLDPLLRSLRMQFWSALRAPVVLCTLCVLVLKCGGGLLAQAPATQVSKPQQGTAATPVEVARTALTEWVATKRILSEEREDWRRGKQTLTSQMEVVRREIESLNARIAEANTSIADAEKKFGELDAERTERKTVSKDLVARINELEDRTQALLPRVPTPLAENIAPISQRLPKNDEQRQQLSLSARYQNVIGVLNAVDKWNRAVTLKSEIRELGTGGSVEVSVLYVGLGQGYYVGAPGKDGKATIAGVGIASPTGWNWRETNDLAPAIQRAVSIYKNEGLAALVRLPVQIR